MNKPTFFPPHLSRLMGPARTSELARSLCADNAPDEDAGEREAKASYRLSANGEKIVRATHASRYIRF